MLIRFIVENFGSFKDRSEFSMVASKVARHPAHVMEFAKKRILRSSFVFGANAGGKTSFFRALEFAVDIVRKGIRHVDCSGRNFRLCNKPSDNGMFQFDFITDGHVYSYGFVVSYSTVSIIAEWLYLCDDAKNNICIFNRENVKNKICVQTGIAEPIIDTNWWDFYKKDFVGGDNSQTLVLGDLALRSAENNGIVEHVLSVTKWFRRFTLISPEQIYNGGLYLRGDEAAKAKLESYLRHFDTGITKIVLKDVDYDDVAKKLPSYIRDDIQHGFKKMPDGLRDRITASVSNDKVAYFFSPGKGKVHIRAQQLMFEHGFKTRLFERREESDGTRRLLDILPLLITLESGAIVVIDEIDRSLHTKATTEFIKQFLEQDNRLGSQLIATTHDGEVLDLDLLRQDEIWFVERGDDYVSRLFPLTKFKVRFDMSVKKDYLLGRYGALPIFGRLGELEP